MCLVAAGASGCNDSSDGPGDQDDDGAAEDADGDGDGDGGSGDDGVGSNCVSNEKFFEEEVQPILGSNCNGCHNTAGEASQTGFILQPNAAPDYLEANLAIFNKMSKLRFEGEPWILLKPTGRMEHQGGVRFELESEEHLAFQEMIDRLEDPQICDDEGDIVGDFFVGVELLDAPATLRKAAVLLAGRVPTAEELAAAEEQGIDGLADIMSPMLHEERFYERVREAYNDRFLTRRYHSSNGSDSAAIDLLDRNDFPQAEYWMNNPDEDNEMAGVYANDAIAEEPTRMVEYLLRNDLPYSEIVTADYTVVNPYSAKVYDVAAEFVDETDPNEFVPAKLPGIPHAGVTSMITYLTRYTTTRTNRNRARSRRYQEFFMATDVIALGTRPTDASGSAYDNPTLLDANCVSCHAAVDPIAGTFANWDEMGRYRPQGHPLRGDNEDNPDLLDVPETGWYSDMRPAGFKGEAMPGEWEPAALQWLGHKSVNDDLFALGPVYLVYEGLFGRKPLLEPTDPTQPDFVQAVLAAKVQRQVFREIAQKFADSNFDLRVVFTEIVKSQYFRAHNSEELSDERRLELSDVGMARLLTPEELNRKIFATTGNVWGPLEDPNLLSRDEFMILYGGIDSDNVTERAYDASGTSANIAKRMSMEVACDSVALDFSRAGDDRMLFPMVEPTDISRAAVEDNAVYLHGHLLGEYLDADDPEVQRTVDLWMAVHDEGERGLLAMEYPTALPGMCQANNDPWTGEPIEVPVIEDPNYAIRSWSAVVAYLLTDYKFLHD
ncbi:MAG: hypothetical protein AAF721_13670 [Myxococcota bacterium]